MGSASTSAPPRTRSWICSRADRACSASLWAVSGAKSRATWRCCPPSGPKMVSSPSTPLAPGPRSATTTWPSAACAAPAETTVTCPGTGPSDLRWAVRRRGDSGGQVCLNAPIAAPGGVRPEGDGLDLVKDALMPGGRRGPAPPALHHHRRLLRLDEGPEDAGAEHRAACDAAPPDQLGTRAAPGARRSRDFGSVKGRISID